MLLKIYMILYIHDTVHTYIYIHTYIHDMYAKNLPVCCYNY
jgi:hypothetical protein